MAQSHKDAAFEFLRLVAAGKVNEACEKHVGPGFRHHNPFFCGDAGSLKQAMAVVHLFRFENGRIAEFWDVGQAVPENPVNEHGMF